jgi:hypothetical protein
MDNIPATVVYVLNTLNSMYPSLKWRIVDNDHVDVRHHLGDNTAVELNLDNHYFSIYNGVDTVVVDTKLDMVGSEYFWEEVDWGNHKQVKQAIRKIIKRARYEYDQD